MIKAIRQHRNIIQVSSIIHIKLLNICISSLNSHIHLLNQRRISCIDESLVTILVLNVKVMILIWFQITNVFELMVHDEISAGLIGRFKNLAIHFVDLEIHLQI
jgi:hypothetical protein